MPKYAIMRRVRTEELKAQRRIYGDRGGHLHFAYRRVPSRLGNAQTSLALRSLLRHFRDHRWEPRPDGISNTISTFDKDNYLWIEYD